MLQLYLIFDEFVVFPVGIHNYAPKHMDLAVEFLSKTSTKYPYERLVGPLYKLSQFESAVKDALTSRYWRVGIMPGVE